MPKIGIVLSGCAVKGAYEIGCMRAIIERFGTENIVAVSSASMGSLIANAFALGNEKKLEALFKEFDTGKHGRRMFRLPAKEETAPAIDEILSSDIPYKYEHYVSLWNTTKSNVEYVPFHKLAKEDLLEYQLSVISLPVFTQGRYINDEHVFDGAVLDNIPVYPLLGKDLDFIFCVYFDQGNYMFESEDFDKKIIKLYDFPNEDRFGLLLYKPGSYKPMYDYGYEYTSRVIRRIFSDDDKEKIYGRIEEHNNPQKLMYTKRCTLDVVIGNINSMTKKYMKRRIEKTTQA